MDRYAVTPPLPAVLGAEAAGVVEALGAGVDGFAIGQRVAAPLFANNSLGAYAEFVVIDANLAVPLPDAISFEQAAALMIQGSRRSPSRGKRRQRARPCWSTPPPVASGPFWCSSPSMPARGW
jgi:NADPH2:quinone reductase